MVITTNMFAANASRQMAIVGQKKEKTAEKLSSGYAINRSADDASGLRISEGMRRMVRGLDRGSDNMEDGISLVQTADGALGEVADILQRMNELSIQSANGTNSTVDRTAIQEEVSRLAAEIDRIGKATTFNEQAIFDFPSKSLEAVFRDRIRSDQVERIQLVRSEAADKGYLSDALKIGNTGNMWHPTATLDFSNVSEDNILLLNGKGFTFHCSDACYETFEFKFKFKEDGDGTQSSVTGQDNIQGQHVYTIDISTCRTGADVVDTLFDYVKDHKPKMPSGISTKPLLNDALRVSHSNELVKTGNQLCIYAVTGCNSPEAAQKKYITLHTNRTKSGAIDAKDLLGLHQTIEKHAKGYDGGYNDIYIQGSSNTHDGRILHIRRMNAEILGVRELDLTTEAGIDEAIGIISKALSRISESRSELGAEQNRLGHASRNNKSTMENTQASELRIRDTDMAKETITLSSQNILTQSGMSVLTQANQTPEGALALLA